MKCVSVCVLAVAMATMAAGVRAQDEVEPAKEPMPPFGLPAGPAADAKPAPPRAPMFAAASAALARRLAPEQREERRFLKDAAANTRFEFEAARLALSRSASASVRSLADSIVQHHLAVTPTLQHMLHARGMAPPMLANDQRKTLNRLARIGGKKFDHEFIERVAVKAQREDLQLFEHASAAVKDPALKGWIDKTLPTVKYQVANAEHAASPDVKTARSSGQPATSSKQAARGGGSPFAQSAATATQMMGASRAPIATGVSTRGASYRTE